MRLRIFVCLNHWQISDSEKISIHLIDSHLNMLNGLSMNISLDNNRKINQKIFRVYLDIVDNSKISEKTHIMSKRMCCLHITHTYMVVV